MDLSTKTFFSADAFCAGCQRMIGFGFWLNLHLINIVDWLSSEFRLFITQNSINRFGLKVSKGGLQKKHSAQRNVCGDFVAPTCSLPQKMELLFLFTQTSYCVTDHEVCGGQEFELTITSVTTAVKPQTSDISQFWSINQGPFAWKNSLKHSPQLCSMQRSEMVHSSKGRW